MGVEDTDFDAARPKSSLRVKVLALANAGRSWLYDYHSDQHKKYGVVFANILKRSGHERLRLLGLVNFYVHFEKDCSSPFS